MDITWLDIWKFHGAALLAGCVIDWMAGDPLWLPHPVRLMGTMISWLESRLRKWAAGPGKQKENQDSQGVPHGKEEHIQCPGPEKTREAWAGVLLTASMCALWWCIPRAVFSAAEHLLLARAWAVLLLAEGFLCSLMLAARGLYTESMKVCRSLEAGRTEEARYNVSMIVGRDTSVLDEGGIARAAVETVAENASDGVIAPFLFMALLGPAGGALYKAVNTMDSMVGYKNDRYLYFGRCAARLDDLFNLIPARLTGVLMVLGAWVLPGMDGVHAWKVFLRDRKRHASPNSAHGEAACAGALHLRMAGDAWYFGTLHKKPYIGDDGRRIEPADIRRANLLMFFTEGVMVLGLGVLLLLL